MPMTASGLQAVMNSQLASMGTPTSASEQNSFTLALATAIVSYITANAVVSGPVVVVSVSGVTSGGGVSGPGTGTLTGGTIS